MSNEETVHIVDDDEAMRKSLSMLMNSMNINAKTYASAEEFLNEFSSEEPSCILLDVRMPGLSGLELQERLPANNINTPVVIMTGYGDIPTAVKAMKAGAIDFIEKPFDHDVLLDTIHRCIKISKHNSSEVEKKNQAKKINVLTPRELEVFKLLVDGKINKVIAAELGLSVRTVEAHRANIMTKLKANSISDLVKIGIYSDLA